MAESENDQERMRRWFREAQERGGPIFHAGRYISSGYYTGDISQQPAKPATPSKDWSKIETYWPHLVKQGGAVAPRRGV